MPVVTTIEFPGVTASSYESLGASLASKERRWAFSSMLVVLFPVAGASWMCGALQKTSTASSMERFYQRRAPWGFPSRSVASVSPRIMPGKSSRDGPMLSFYRVR